MFLALISINKDFGENFYNSVSRSLFFILLIIVVFSLIGSVLKGDKFFSIFGSVCVSCFVLFMFLNPDSFVYFGGFVYDMVFDVLKGMKGDSVLWIKNIQRI